MSKESTLKREYKTEEDWLDDIFIQSNSKASLKTAKTALVSFGIFCKTKVGLPDPDISDLETERVEQLKQKGTPLSKHERYAIEREFWAKVRERRTKVCNEARSQILEKYQQWFEAGDIQSICTSLQGFVRFCSQDHQDVIQNKSKPWKAKKARTIKGYFGTVRDFLRNCYGVRITTEDVKDYIKFPKNGKQRPEPLTLENIKLVLAHADPRRRAMYYLLCTSGMRLGEALSLKRSNFKTDMRPIKIHLHAKDTKTLEARDTFITEEAWERVAPIYEATKEGEYLFHDYIFGEKLPYKVIPTPTPTPIYDAVQTESRYFIRLRDTIGKKYGHKEPCLEFPNGTGVLKRYEDSCRNCVHIHAMRAYFMTIAESVHGNNYAHALSGHHAYLDQYIRKTEKQRAKMYLELEKHLLLESSKVHSEQFHEAEIAELQEIVAKLKAESDRKEEPEFQKVTRDSVGA